MLHPEAQKHIRDLSEQELLEYIRAGTALYQPDAIEFALQEFERRYPGSEHIAELKIGVRRGDVSENAATAQAEALLKEPPLPPRANAARKLKELGTEYIVLGTCLGLLGFVATFIERATEPGAVAWSIFIALMFFAGLHFLVARRIQRTGLPWVISALALATFSAVSLTLGIAVATLRVLVTALNKGRIDPKDAIASVAGLFFPLLIMAVMLRAAVWLIIYATRILTHPSPLDAAPHSFPVEPPEKLSSSDLKF
jgi:hypothetical protein